MTVPQPRASALREIWRRGPGNRQVSLNLAAGLVCPARRPFSEARQLEMSGNEPNHQMSGPAVRGIRRQAARLQSHEITHQPLTLGERVQGTRATLYSRVCRTFLDIAVGAKRDRTREEWLS